jgi:hypothetical protein
LISAFSLVAMLLVFTGCGDNLANSVYTFSNDYQLCLLKFCENNKFILTGIDYSRIKENEPLYIAYGDKFEDYEYRKEGKSIKVIKGGIIKDEMIFEKGIVKYRGLELELDNRFSTIKNSKYAGKLFVANSGSEKAIIFAFINDKKVVYIKNMKKNLPKTVEMVS